MSALEGKSAVVAAGAKNLGGLISRTLAQRGVNVAVHYNSAASEADADRTVAEVTAAGAQAIKVQGDLTVPANITALFDAAVGAFGGVDIAVNTVGKVLRKPILETTEAEYDSMFDINAKAAYFFIQEAGRRLNDQGSLTTIVTSLLAAYTDGYSTYAGAKSPVEHFVRAASKEFAPRLINVNNIAPGPMDTPFFYPQETPERAQFHASQAMGDRLTNISDIAPLAVFLAGEGHWITGQTIFANGGYTTR
ncbi:SDR family oxidoreductase [Mycolicibacterium sp. 120266]|jgi:NAD(P)-dependent dehydrogenase (short-subunit alcohol dehydrogenase family)|uniref:SDR family oxidoreductase n=1 Tax=Mycolicibacterium sp. 120266 TaxID=3090601 RepID=UPI00299CFCAC|nr:SDR family oxidoreductase [Mycolicibacterium sp. 120266]MDX1876039.1 SDR family oxidoreductase [Mycolicibacterium sp. 120266]